MLSCCFLDFSVGLGDFVIGLSQISSFFSYTNDLITYQVTSKQSRQSKVMESSIEIDTEKVASIWPTRG